MENIHTIINITTITAIMPTTAPALKIPPMTEQLLRHSISSRIDGKYNFFMMAFFHDII